MHVNRFTLAAMLGTFTWPAELQSAAEQVTGYLRRPENPGTREIIDGPKEK